MRKLMGLLCVLLCAASLHGPPAHADSKPQQVPGLVSFTLDKREAAKGELVTAHFRLSKPAQAISITATTYDGSPVGFTFPQTATISVFRTEGAINFTIPNEAGTLSPLLMTLNIDGSLRGLNKLMVACDNAWFFTPRVEACPFDPVLASPAAVQRFERGLMIWLGATDSIYVLYEPSSAQSEYREQFIYNRQIRRFDDAFLEGDPESDPRYAPPAGKQQPVRGFGLVWRANAQVREAVGWALEKEQGYTACYGTGLVGWRSMRTFITLPGDRLIEYQTHNQPTYWRELTKIDGRPIQFTGC
jgi:hypothetical protein